jgi:hypothetical protein
MVDYPADIQYIDVFPNMFAREYMAVHGDICPEETM